MGRCVLGVLLVVLARLSPRVLAASLITVLAAVLVRLVLLVLLLAAVLCQYVGREGWNVLTATTATDYSTTVSILVQLAKVEVMRRVSGERGYLSSVRLSTE